VKNAVDFLVCTITWVAIGYGFAFGPTGGEFLGGGIWPLFEHDKIDSTSSEWCASAPALTRNLGGENRGLAN